MKRVLLVFMLLLQVPFYYAFRTPAPQNRDMIGAAQALLQALPEAQRQAAFFPFDDAERFNWHFVPRSRKGLALKDMDARQRQLAIALLKTGMSEQGYDKAQAIM